jgi:glutamine synthetase
VIASDRIVLFKHLVKNVVNRFGMEATFMPKPFDGMPGNGMHCHLSLADMSGKNVFDPGPGKEFLSDTALMFMAGILHHGAALTAVLCPTVNSYKRHDTRFEAPTSIGWARKHRGAFVRVPECLVEERSRASRFELRIPDPAANPYLALLAILACGVDGLKNKMEPPPPQEETSSELDETGDAQTRRVPKSLIEAIGHLKESDVIKNAFGERLFENVLVALEAQWYEYQREHLSKVSYWEVEKYLRT